MRTGFIMINYNDYENIKKMLDMIQNYSILDKIVIVDNASTDDSFQKLKQIQNEKIIVLSNTHNGGYGSGINVGAKYLNQIYSNCNIIISNTDIVIEKEEDIKNLLGSFNETTAVVGPIIKEHTGYNCGWKIPSPWQDILLSLPYLYKSFSKKIKYSKKEIQGVKEVEAVSGSFFAINGKDLEKVNYFDENVFLYYEENILAKKLQKIGKKIKINGNVEVFHNHSVTIDKAHTSVQKYKNLKRSQFYFQKEYNHAGIINQFVMKILFQMVILGLQIRNHHKSK